MPVFLALAVAGVVAAGVEYPAERANPASALMPAIGAEQTVTAGSPMLERQAFVELAAVQVGATVGKMTSGGKRTIQAGQLLAILRDEGKLTACQTDVRDEALCLTDRDGDGNFDVVNTWDGVFPAKIPGPMPYRRGVKIAVPDPAGTFRQTLTFMGVSGATLRLSYREFVNDMARPAFTDEITFTLSGKFPERVAYRDLAIDVLGVGNAGIRYVIIGAGK